MAAESPATESTTRSASVSRINGCRSSRRPKVDRPAVWFNASNALRRMAPAVAVAMPILVALTMSIICGRPRSMAPTCHAKASRRPTSAEAIACVPNFSLRRWMTNELRVPSSSSRGMRKRPSPRGPGGAPRGLASTRMRSLCAQLANHFSPERRQVPSPAGVATLSLAPTSDPPAFSVRNMATVR